MAKKSWWEFALFGSRLTPGQVNVIRKAGMSGSSYKVAAICMVITAVLIGGVNIAKLLLGKSDGEAAWIALAVGILYIGTRSWVALNKSHIVQIKHLCVNHGVCWHCGCPVPVGLKSQCTKCGATSEPPLSAASGTSGLASKPDASLQP